MVWQQKNKGKLNRIVKQASRVIGLPVAQLEDVAERDVLAKWDAIVKDSTHPLHEEVTYNRSGRIRLPKMRTDRFRLSFLPCAMKLFNANFTRWNRGIYTGTGYFVRIPVNELGTAW